MDEIVPGWTQVRSVWWLLMWRGSIPGFIVGLVGGLGIKTGPAGAIISLIVGVIWSLFVVRMALRKQYKGFRIALIATT